MIVYSDNAACAEQFLSDSKINWERIQKSNTDSAVRPLSQYLFFKDDIFKAKVKYAPFWKYLFFVETALMSQYDVLLDLSRKNITLPDGILCLAGEGQDFHGFEKRSWAATYGNIHLSVHLSPQQKIEKFNIGFLVLSAVSLIQTMDSINGFEGRAAIKWVNDILVNNCKVAGFIVNTQSMNDIIVGAVLGIGINVEKKPDVERDKFVPQVAAICDFINQNSSKGLVFKKFTERLLSNYELLCKGGYKELVEVYKTRSLIIGKKVALFDKSKEIARGKVEKIGDNLELFIEGNEKPIVQGKLVFL